MPHILERLLSEKSKKLYEAAYKSFMDWRSLRDDDELTEDLLLAYFEGLSETYSSPTLWSCYSMLRSTLAVNNGINIESYTKLREYIKQRNKGYKAKRTKIFTPDEITRFLEEAPDITYLGTKVALIMGVMGACRANELYAMTIDDIQDLGSAMIVSVNVKPNTYRQFTLTGNYYEICKNYLDLRPNNATTAAFFLTYQNGKCTLQNMGIHKFGVMGRQIARFLDLPNPDTYTGRSFLMSSLAIQKR